MSDAYVSPLPPRSAEPDPDEQAKAMAEVLKGRMEAGRQSAGMTKSGKRKRKNAKK